MENPATWGPVERVIDDELDAIHRDDLKPGFSVGLSRARRIADALRDHGLIDLEAEAAQKEKSNG